MIERLKYHQQIETALDRQAVVALVGPRQSGKTTLALDIGQRRGAVYLDLESSADRLKLTDPAMYLRHHADKLVILDEIHRAPEIFETLRGLVDESRRQGQRYGRFLILGSASIELLKQSGESLAGRIEYVELAPLNAKEVALQNQKENAVALQQLWLRGGFPDSFLAKNDTDSLAFRRNFIRTYLERDIPQFGVRIAAETLERFWTMLAHGQGALLNSAKLASSLSVSAPTINSYLDLMVDLLLVRRLPPYHGNIKKRLVKSPRIYIRDSGLLHALLNIPDAEALLGHPQAGASWEGFVIENLISIIGSGAKPMFYRTAAGAEIDLVLNLADRREIWAIEIKRGSGSKPTKGFYNARDDLMPDRCFVVYQDVERYPIAKGVEAIGLSALMNEVVSG